MAGSGSAQDMKAPVDCTTAQVALPPELSGWASRVPLSAARDKAGLDRAVLTPGKALTAKLVQTGGVRYPLRPEKPGGSVSYGGLLSFSIREAGNYRVALGSGAWIDVVRDGKPVPSIAHGHGPDCSGIRKTVNFTLTPGRYLLQLSANGTETLPVMIARLP
jgi:hypothetical protein